MLKKELDFNNDIFVFETVMRVRHIELDMAQYLTLESLTALLCEARQRFFYSRGIKEINADYHGLIIDELQLSIVSRVKAREELLFEVGVEPLYDNGGTIVIKTTRMNTGEIVAKARQHFVNYDLQLNKPIALDKTMKEALYPYLYRI